MKKVTIILLFFLLSDISYAQINNRNLRERLTSNLDQQFRLYSQEKLHLHLDRDYYIPGENIWFKAYLVDAQTHLSIAESRYIYVELINAEDELVDRVMLRADEELFFMYHGHLFLSEVIPEGDYTIRAYTRHMENLGADYFFTQNIHIGSLESQTQATKEAKTKQAKLSAVKKDYAVSFFPEGGNLLMGVSNRIAFKALNNSGYSEFISGEVVDEAGSTITTIQTSHLGMGMFVIYPEEGKSYYAVCRNEEGMEKRFELPKAASGYSLLTDSQDGLFVISVQKTADIERIPLYIMIHNRGNLLYFEPVDEWKNYISLKENQLPAGVLHILLFDSSLNPISERLVFSRNEEKANLELSTDKESYKMREKVTSQIQVKDAKGRSTVANLSVSVVDEKDIPVNESISILTSLLLTSELRGFIESPGFYFQENTRQSRFALDCLMMTQGWRRYNIADVVKGNIQTPDIPIERSLEISGQVLGVIDSQPRRDAWVSLLSFNSREVLQTTTNASGKFSFPDLEFPDGNIFMLQSITARNSESNRLIADKEIFPHLTMQPVNPNPQTFYTEQETAKKQENSFLAKAEERIKYDDDMRIIYLKEVEIVGRKSIPRIMRGSELKEGRSIYSGVASYSVGIASIEEDKPVNIWDMLRRIPGVSVFADGTVRFQGGTGLPAIYIDDIQISEGEATSLSSSSEGEGELGEELAYMGANEFAQALSTIPINQIERIDVFMGVESSIFGAAGGAGVINITSKQDANFQTSSSPEANNRKLIKPLGYQEPAEFYSPIYDTEEKRFDIKPDLRTTIYWKPDIVTKDNGSASFDFYTADYTTNYSIVIEGVTSDGEIIREVKKIQVE
ncbi:TonB-dependent receptor plug domain-containing protein [Parabacteroides sp. OttesenSCG-928-G07]|nr:TonB-dependent receptor plug domain-containing protein [Parabacteroides sp. OttesenSCG-928-G07]